VFSLTQNSQGRKKSGGIIWEIIGSYALGTLQKPALKKYIL